MNASTPLVFTLPDNARAITKRWKNAGNKRMIHADGSLIFVNATSKWSLRFRNEKTFAEYDSYELARIAHAERAVFGKLLLPDEGVIEGDKILLVGGSWITANGGNGHTNIAKDFIEVRRPNIEARNTTT